jgi:hypothetical protein
MKDGFSDILIITSLTKTATANYMISAFRSVGCSVTVCSDMPGGQVDHVVSGAVNTAALVSRLGLRPDLTLFIEGGTMQLLPVGLENLSCITAWYGIDTHMDYAKHLRIGRLFDVTFVAQKEYIGRLRTDGLRQVHWLPLAFATELTPEFIPERTIDISYVGSNNAAINPERHALLDSLRREFPSHSFGQASPREMEMIYGKSLLVFNKSINNDVNMRFFEAAGVGAALVTDRVKDNGLEELFEEGEHYIVYRDKEDLIEKVRSLLADRTRCSRIGAQARRHVLDRHTYRHRIETLLQTVSHSIKTDAPGPEDYFPACLSLNLLSPAFEAAAGAVDCSNRGAYRRIAGKGCSLLLKVMASGIGLIERMKNRRSLPSKSS